MARIKEIISSSGLIREIRGQFRFQLPGAYVSMLFILCVLCVLLWQFIFGLRLAALG
jgi:hypothetical protein